MATVSKYVLAAVAGTTMLAFSAASASAAYACNGNVCWEVKEKYTYPADSKVVIREESWNGGLGKQSPRILSIEAAT